MADTGATFTFYQKVVKSESGGNASKPLDDTKLSPTGGGGSDDGQKSGEYSASTHAIYSFAMGKLKQTYSTILSQISGSTALSQQVNTANSILQNGVMIAASVASGNFVAAAASVTGSLISYGFSEAQYQRETAWKEYERSVYNENRGASTYNRSRRF